MGGHWTVLVSWLSAGNKCNYPKSPLAEVSTEERAQSELLGEGETGECVFPGLYHWMWTMHMDTPQLWLHLCGTTGTLCSSLDHGESGEEQKEKGVPLAVTRELHGFLESATKGPETSAVQITECQKGSLKELRPSIQTLTLKRRAAEGRTPPSSPNTVKWKINKSVCGLVFGHVSGEERGLAFLSALELVGGEGRQEKGHFFPVPVDCSSAEGMPVLYPADENSRDSVGGSRKPCSGCPYSSWWPSREELGILDQTTKAQSDSASIQQARFPTGGTVGSWLHWPDHSPQGTQRPGGGRDLFSHWPT